MPVYESELYLGVFTVDNSDSLSKQNRKMNSTAITFVSQKDTVYDKNFLSVTHYRFQLRLFENW